MGHTRKRNNFGLLDMDVVCSTRVGQRGNLDRIWMDGSGCASKMAALLTCAILLSVQPAMATLSGTEVSALNSIKEALLGGSSVLNWGTGDPCTNGWTGVQCDRNNSTVQRLMLANLGLSGTVPSQIGDLTGLQWLDFSNNPSITGPLPTTVGNLTKLTRLVLQYCNFNGGLPSSIGNLRSLDYLGLSANNFSGPIPPEIGSTNLTWMDISSNRFSGRIPVSTNSSKNVGLDNITVINHFHFSNNSLEGNVPVELFSPSLRNLLHLLVDNNRLSGTLHSVSSFPPKLNILRLDSNNFNGSVPAGYGNATNLTELRLNDNQFVGPMPNFTDLANLTLLDVSNNKFDQGSLPSWVTSLNNLETLNFAFTQRNGSVPPRIFQLPNIQGINISNNFLSGVLTFLGNTGPDLAGVALMHNNITGLNGDPSTSANITLQSNPICSNHLISLNTDTCGTFSICDLWTHPQNYNDSCPHFTDSSCKDNMKANPYTCRCAYPLDLQIRLTAPMFSNLSWVTEHEEEELATKLKLNRNQVVITDISCHNDKQVNVETSIFPDPKDGDYFPRDDGNAITQALGHHEFNLDEGPYLLPWYEYTGPSKHKEGLGGSAIAGIAVGSAAAFLIIASSLLFGVYYKKRADKLAGSNPFASWGGGSSEFGEAPKLKGARWFSLAELKQYTDSWSNDFQIGEGGYGKVYRGVLPSGDLVAIKRATAGSMQGANEFKNEIELLSRAHHRNLVGLVGFCYEGGEQALIYEFMSNGTLQDHLKGRADSPLTWDMRLDIATASARGIAYLHDHANPPIIHRDLKSPNILLNEKLVAKVADFGLSKLAPEDGEKVVYSMDVKGTLGYLDPEYYSSAILTDKSDIYSFGVVLLELVTARPPIDHGKYVVREIRTALARGGVEAVRALMDPTIRDAVSTSDLDRYLKVALPCVEDSGDSRPTIAEVVRRLEALDELPSAQDGPGSFDIDGQGNSGGKKVKFSREDPTVINEGDDKDLLNRKDDTFQYSGAYGMSTTVRPK